MGQDGLPFPENLCYSINTNDVISIIYNMVYRSIREQHSCLQKNLKTEASYR
ncbi:hypothetical protein MKW98_018967, partial [Papaver atlanticum]